MSITSSQLKSWHPDRPVSKGSTSYHNAVVNAPYYLENLDVLVDLVKPKIRDNETVVDFGAGTGVSAMHLLRKLKAKFNLYLVDNSAAWLGKAYEILSNYSNVKFFLLEKKEERYATLAETIGEKEADHVVCANTVHLIPELENTFKCINSAMKQKGTFTFQSGNIFRQDRKKGVLMVDDTIIRVHDIALDMIS